MYIPAQLFPFPHVQPEDGVLHVLEVDPSNLWVEV